MAEAVPNQNILVSKFLQLFTYSYLYNWITEEALNHQ